MKFFDVPALYRLVLPCHLFLLFAIGLTPKLPAQTVIFSDGFENGLSGWQAGDYNIDLPGTPSYWGVVNFGFGGTVVGTHSGTNKAYCAAVGFMGTTLSPNYQPNMTAILSRTINLTGYTNATLSFWHQIPAIEGDDYDYVQVLVDNAIVWTTNRAFTSWTKVTLSLDSFLGAPRNLQFVFVSDRSIQYEGWYLDDILVTDAFTPAPPPANDNFAAAKLLPGATGATTGANGSATFQTGEPTDGFSATNSIWYRWTAVTNGTVTFRTGGSSFDTVLCIYSGGSVSALTPVDCDDNGDTNGASLISFEAVKDVIYRISVRGVNNARGIVQLEWNQPAGIGVDQLPDVGLWVSESEGFLYGWYLDRNEPTRPGRTLLRASTATINTGTGPLELIGSSSSPGVVQRIYRSDGGTRDRDVDGGSFTFHPSHGHLHFDNWLNFNIREILPSNGVGVVVAAGDKTSFAIIDLGPYNLNLPGAPGEGHYDGGLVQGMSVGWADVYSGTLMDQWIDVTDVPPGRYWLEASVDPENRVLELNESNNVARILVDLGGLAAPPNDNFANAVVLTGISVGALGSNANATKEAGEPVHGTANTGGASIWYRWTAPSNMTATISTEGSGFDTVLAVYTGGNVAGLFLIAKNDDVVPEQILHSRVTFNATAGTIYRIAVDGYRSSSGEVAAGGVELNINPAWNNNLDRAIPLTGMSGSVHGSTRGATRQAGEPQHAGVNGTNSIWYTWIAPTNGSFTFSTIGSGFDTLLAVYTGAAYPLTLVAENNNLSASNFASRVTFDAVSGTTYRIAVDGFPGVFQAGIVKLSWNGPTPPAIVTQPVSTNLPAGASVQFTVGVSGTAPFYYQWRRSGTNLLSDERISGTTSPTLTIGKIYASDAASYSVVITNAWGAVTSTPANLIVIDNPRVVYINHHTAPLGGGVTVPVQMQAVGDERTFQFSLAFDPALLTNPQVTTGANSAGAALTVDPTQVGSGRLGVTLALASGQTLPASSTLEIARVTFGAAAGASNGAVSAVGFGNQPIARSVLSTYGTSLITLFVAGSVALENMTSTASGQIMANGSFHLSLIGPPSHTYVIEATTNLTTQSWVPVFTNQTSAAGVLQFLDTTATNYPFRFFRARMVQ